MSCAECIKNEYDDLSADDCCRILSSVDSTEIEDVFCTARRVADEFVGKRIYLRGLIEISNVCRKDCYYCGIRKSNASIQRYRLTSEEAFHAVDTCIEAGFGSIVIQAGESADEEFIDVVDECISYACRKSNGTIGITLSLGEQSHDVYRRWFDSGATRYLLRIETSNPDLYSKLHPADHSFEERLNCLETLKKIGYQVGTGVLIGVPGQTIKDCADDIMFYKQIDADMIGMGPYIIHPDTPLGTIALKEYSKIHIVNRALRMIALTRIVCRDVNIASTTALQVLDSDAVIQSFLYGANIKMINVTPERYRLNYNLYAGKKTVSAAEQIKKLEAELNTHGFTICYNQKGDAPHYAKRTG